MSITIVTCAALHLDWDLKRAMGFEVQICLIGLLPFLIKYFLQHHRFEVSGSTLDVWPLPSRIKSKINTFMSCELQPPARYLALKLPEV